MVSWESQSQQISQTDFIEWTFVGRSVTSLVLMGCAPGVMWGTVLHEGAAGSARGCYGRAENRQAGNKGSCQEDVGGLCEGFSE